MQLLETEFRRRSGRVHVRWREPTIMTGEKKNLKWRYNNKQVKEISSCYVERFKKKMFY